MAALHQGPFALQKLRVMTKTVREPTLLPPAPSLLCTHTSCLSEDGEVFSTVLQAHREL